MQQPSRDLGTEIVRSFSPGIGGGLTPAEDIELVADTRESERESSKHIHSVSYEASKYLHVL